MKEDAWYVEQARQGDTGAFGQLVHQHQNRLFNTILHVTGNREEAEDVVQDAFFQAYTKLDSFRGNSSFFTWLYRIAFNLAVTRQRRKKVEAAARKQREAAAGDLSDADESPPERALREERASQLHAAINALSEEHRAILVLRELEECSYEQIAEILEMPVGTVRSRLHRSRLQLREKLHEMLRENPMD